MENITEMLKGVLEGCVLEIIRRQKTYGYAITASLRDLGFTDVVEGTVYTILLRLEKERLVRVDHEPSEVGPPRKCYALTRAGRMELEHFWTKWKFISSRMQALKNHPYA